MAQINTREILLANQISTAVTTNGTAPVMVLPMGYTSAILTLNILTVSGTTPTLNVFVQNRLRQPSSTDSVGQDVTDSGTPVFDDLLAFLQATTSNTTFIFRICGAGNANSNGANKNATLTAGSAQSGPLGGSWRVAWTAGGTTPSFQFSVSAQLIP